MPVDAGIGRDPKFARDLPSPFGMERDEIGSDLVPDYLSSVRDGGFYGGPVDVLSGFLDAESGVACGRPVGVALDKRGALLVADDVGNVVWRVSGAAR